jgi:hypothetical protein
MLRRIASLVGAALVVAALLAPATARAAGSVDIALIGTFTDPGGVTGSVGGVLSIDGFVDADGLAATGTATYSLCIPGVDPKNCLATLTQTMQVAVADLTASCSGVTVDLAGVTVVSPPSLDGFTLAFDPSSLQLVPANAPAERAACAIARKIDHGGRSASLARLLNRLLANL